VIYLSDKYATTDASVASKNMLAKAGVAYRQVKPGTEKIVLSFNEVDV
jgi:hypothetical protein